MATNQIPGQLAQPIPTAEAGAEALAESWYALHTRSRHEKMVAQRLAEWGVTTFLPMVTEVRRWSDRKKSVQLPLLAGYCLPRLLPTETNAFASWELTACSDWWVPVAKVRRFPTSRWMRFAGWSKAICPGLHIRSSRLDSACASAAGRSTAWKASWFRATE